ncbi:hypothetical protein [Herbiconiux liangxiaofengii]|uniref:hypothetical protein n=1 Tax=Herbiconiux liangxiaofengii TaxID=3342795 RepID=UPI0035B92B80
MIVRCNHVAGASDSSWVTPGVDYPVVESGVQRDGKRWLRIITDNGETALFPASRFTIVDGSVPVNWVRIVRESGTTMTPMAWTRPDFWEAFYDGDLIARNTYYDELATILDDLPEWWLRAQVTSGHIVNRQSAVIAMDYGQFTVSGGGASDPLQLVEAALTNPPSSDDGKTVLVLSPHQNNFAMPVDIEICSARPIDDRADWEQVSEHAVAVGAQGVVIASPTLDEHRFDLEPGDYLLEISGRKFVVIGWPGTTNPNDEWRIRFWPRWGQKPRPAKIWLGPHESAR